MRHATIMLLTGCLLAGAAPALAQVGGLGAWQNPDIGFVYDLKFDLHDAERDADGRRKWTTRGFDLSTAELSLGAEADPYGRIDFNAMFFEEGAEIHELFFTMPHLAGGLKARGGQFLGSFGRWSRFHSHALPFVSEPRLLHEYLGGHFMPQGLELSWLVPTNQYVEVYGGVFDAISGHAHDSDPASSGDGWGPDNPPPGCHYHGDELHCPDDPQAEAAYRALLEDPDAPLAPAGNRELSGLAWLGRVQTSVEAGLDWSLDVGASILHQDAYRTSRRFPGTDYAKTVAGFDLAVFWNPPERNLYRGLDFGVEYVRNQEQFEVLDEENWVRREQSRDGTFTWFRYRLNRTWEFGATRETFAARQGADDDRTRTGGFLTYNISHYQRLRLEYVRDDRGAFADDVNHLVLQFDGTIGFHTHGRQR
jgi:hypothetical protein